MVFELNAGRVPGPVATGVLGEEPCHHGAQRIAACLREFFNDRRFIGAAAKPAAHRVMELELPQHPKLFALRSPAGAFECKACQRRSAVSVTRACTPPLFGPVKFAYLPQHLSERELTGGKGLTEMGTLVTILLGNVMLWWRGGGSNSRPSHCERDALPAELPPHTH